MAVLKVRESKKIYTKNKPYHVVWHNKVKGVYVYQ